MHKYFLTSVAVAAVIALPAYAGMSGNSLTAGEAVSSSVQQVEYSAENRKGIATSGQILRRLTADKTYSDFYVSPNIDLSIKFKTGSATLSEQAEVQIIELAEALKDPDLLYADIVIEGHTDNVGSAELKKALSKRRAMAVKRELEKNHGVKTDRITAKGYGESKPVADNASEAGRSQNRRVTIVRMK